MKKFLVAIIILLATTVMGISTYDIDGDYTAVAGFDVSGNTYVEQYNVKLESSGIYYIYENRNIGGHNWEYPVIIDTYYIDVNEDIMLNIGDLTAKMRYVNGHLMGFINGMNIALMFTANGILNVPCEFAITEISADKFLLSTNKSSCYFAPNITNASIKTLAYTSTNDAILEVDVTNTGVGEIVDIQIGNIVYTYIPKEL